MPGEDCEAWKSRETSESAEATCYALDYVDCECTEEEDKVVKPVSGYMAGKAYNDLCRMIGGRWPDCKIQEEAPEAHKFFMALFTA
jgi:hypothetical protein